jgi:hypothetical protein
MYLIRALSKITSKHRSRHSYYYLAQLTYVGCHLQLLVPSTGNVCGMPLVNEERPRDVVVGVRAPAETNSEAATSGLGNQSPRKLRTMGSGLRSTPSHSHRSHEIQQREYVSPPVLRRAAASKPPRPRRQSPCV